MNISGKKYSTALWNQYHSGKIPVIPDIKSRSPGEGDLLQGRDPVKLAKALAAAGAPVLSVVTEPRYFGGSPELLRRIVQATSLLILRKDFINKREQLQESVELGASAVLLIASMLGRKKLFKLIEDALMLGLEPLVETHNEAEILSVNELNLTMIGINNRNIVELEMDDGSVSNTERLAGLIGAEVLAVSESSISSSTDVQRAIAAGAHAVLVGTAILQAKDPVVMYRGLSEAGIKSR
ncbi:MAG: indole-3-glycerol-phosphate synthase [Heliobacteriaceae bacterium]|nr:indole-3-glycerol-phosphate synthase [Heliobacteriaceae bacterium]